MGIGKYVPGTKSYDARKAAEKAEADKSQQLQVYAAALQKTDVARDALLDKKSQLTMSASRLESGASKFDKQSRRSYLEAKNATGPALAQHTAAKLVAEQGAKLNRQGAGALTGMRGLLDLIDTNLYTRAGILKDMHEQIERYGRIVDISAILEDAINGTNPLIEGYGTKGVENIGKSLAKMTEGVENAVDTVLTTTTAVADIGNLDLARLVSAVKTEPDEWSDEAKELIEKYEAENNGKKTIPPGGNGGTP